MVETLRFSRIAKEDLAIGTGSLEVRLADGRVVVLSQIRLTDFVSALTTGAVLFVKASGVAGEDATNFFWDATNARLGIGTSSPTTPLHVVGAILGATVGPSSSQQHTLPAVTSDTIALIAATQTLTNKTVTLSSNTLTGTTAQFNTALSDNDFAVVAETVQVLDRDVTVAELVSSAAATDLYTLTVPGGTLSTNRTIRVVALGDYLNNSGAGRTLTCNVVFGGNAIATFTSGSIAASADRRSFRTEAIIAARNATNAQTGHGHHVLGTTNTGASGNAGTPEFNVYGSDNSLAKDSTVNQTLSLRYTHSASDANLSLRIHTVHVEILRS